MKILYDVSDHINIKDVYFEITDKLIIYTYSVLNFKDVKMFLSKYNIRKSAFTHKYYSENLKILSINLTRDEIEILNINSLDFNKVYYFNNKIIKNNILIFNNGFDSRNIFYFKIMEYKSLIFYDYRIVKYDYLFSNKDRITIVLKDL